MTTTPSTETSGLAEAIRSADALNADGDLTCGCGVSSAVWHYPCRAAAALAWLTQRLTEDDVMEAAAKAILRDEIDLGEAVDEWDEADQEWLRSNARAALTAAAALVGGGE